MGLRVFVGLLLALEFYIYHGLRLFMDRLVETSIETLRRGLHSDFTPRHIG